MSAKKDDHVIMNVNPFGWVGKVLTEPFCKPGRQFEPSRLYVVVHWYLYKNTPHHQAWTDIRCVENLTRKPTK